MKEFKRVKPVFDLVDDMRCNLHLLISVSETLGNGRMMTNAVIFELAKLLQEISIASCNGNVEAGMAKVSRAVNASNEMALSHIRKALG